MSGSFGNSATESHPRNKLRRNNQQERRPSSVEIGHLPGVRSHPYRQQMLGAPFKPSFGLSGTTAAVLGHFPFANPISWSGQVLLAVAAHPLRDGSYREPGWTLSHPWFL